MSTEQACRHDRVMEHRFEALALTTVLCMDCEQVLSSVTDLELVQPWADPNHDVLGDLYAAARSVGIPAPDPLPAFEAWLERRQEPVFGPLEAPAEDDSWERRSTTCHATFSDVLGDIEELLR